MITTMKDIAIGIENNIQIDAVYLTFPKDLTRSHTIGYSPN
jgi:hypothetical protein